MKVHNKLVRDKIPEIIGTVGKRCTIYSKTFNQSMTFYLNQN